MRGTVLPLLHLINHFGTGFIYISLFIGIAISLGNMRHISFKCGVITMGTNGTPMHTIDAFESGRILLQLPQIALRQS